MKKIHDVKKTDSELLAARAAQREVMRILGIKQPQIVAWDLFKPSLKLLILNYANMPETFISVSWASMSDEQRLALRTNTKALSNTFGGLYGELTA